MARWGGNFAPSWENTGTKKHGWNRVKEEESIEIIKILCLINSNNTAFNYTEQALILVSAVSCSFWTSAFTSLFEIMVSVTNSPVGWKSCVMTRVINKYKSIIIKKEKRRKLW